MTHWERIEAVLAGQRPDRPPVTAWRHFPGQEYPPEKQVAAHLAFQAEYDWDLVKLQPSSVHFAEAWGAEYDYARYRGNHPELIRPAVAGPDELGRITVVPGDTGPFAAQLQVIRTLRQTWGKEVPLIQTVFSPLSVVETLLGGLRKSRAESRLAQCLASHGVAVHHATAAVATTLVDYSRQALSAGADGIFFAITGLARAAYLTQAEYAAFGRPYDLQVLAAIGDARLNVLHICGPEVYFDDFLHYPVPILSWAASQPGNPSVTEALRRSTNPGDSTGPHTLMGGVDDDAVLLGGTAAAVNDAVRATLAACGGLRLIVAPECSYPPDTPAANVRALRSAVAE